jgi:hypothetical protein
VSKLGRDVPAADDDHRSGKLGQSHHRVGGVKPHSAQARQIGNHRAAAGCNHHPIGGNRLRCPYIQLPRPDEASARIENRDILASLTVAPPVSSHRINPTEDSIPDLPPPDAAEVQINPKPGRLDCRSRKVGGVDQHLARNTANVEARPAERAHLHQCHSEVVEPIVDDRVSRSGTDDAEIEMTHPAIVPAHAVQRYCSVALAAHEKIGPRLGVGGTSLGGRLSRHRRNRISYLALARRSTDNTMHAWYVRVIALVAIAGLSIGSRESVLAIALCLAASLGSFLLWINERHLRRGTQPRFWLSQAYLRNVIKTDGRHHLSLGSYFEIPEAFVLIAIPCWIATDDPLWARLIMLAAGTVFLITTSLLIFNDHTWFNPDEMDPPAWHEIFRRFAGPITALPVCLIALPADWGSNGWLAALAISLMPLAVVGSRISDTDLIMKALPDLVQAESHAGRELVISEAHGALSTHLRLIEQRAREIRDVAPSLYELAVSANSRLRETLTLAQLGRDSSTSVQNLEAPVLTLARAVGAKAEVDISVDTLSAGDRDLARLVLNDLVGNALNAGAGAIRVALVPAGAQVAISVTDDAPPMANGVWKTPGTSSAWLEARLGGVSGSLTSEQDGATKTVTARWRPESE